MNSFLFRIEFIKRCILRRTLRYGIEHLVAQRQNLRLGRMYLDVRSKGRNIEGGLSFFEGTPYNDITCSRRSITNPPPELHSGRRGPAPVPSFTHSIFSLRKRAQSFPPFSSKDPTVGRLRDLDVDQRGPQPQTRNDTSFQFVSRLEQLVSDSQYRGVHKLI